MEGYRKLPVPLSESGLCGSCAVLCSLLLLLPKCALMDTCGPLPILPILPTLYHTHTRVPSFLVVLSTLQSSTPYSRSASLAAATQSTTAQTIDTDVARSPTIFLCAASLKLSLCIRLACCNLCGPVTLPSHIPTSALSLPCIKASRR